MEEISQNRMTNSQEIENGIHDGIPIALGYFVVAFTLGIAARNAGLTPFRDFSQAFSIMPPQVNMRRLR